MSLSHYRTSLTLPINVYMQHCINDCDLYTSISILHKCLFQKDSCAAVHPLMSNVQSKQRKCKLTCTKTQRHTYAYNSTTTTYAYKDDMATEVTCKERQLLVSSLSFSFSTCSLLQLWAWFPLWWFLSNRVTIAWRTYAALFTSTVHLHLHTGALTLPVLQDTPRPRKSHPHVECVHTLETSWH